MPVIEQAREISSCEVCGNQHLRPVLDLGRHPLCDDLVPIGDSRTCVEYPIDILFCDTCLTSHQRFQVPKRELFPLTYHYRSRFTADVLSGMQALVDSCKSKLGSLAGKVVVDIGCNDGSLLDFFAAKGARTIGIEPTNAAADAKAKGHTIYQAFLSADTARQITSSVGAPDFITFTNVFAHIENLTEVLEAIRELVGARTALVIENHYLGAVLAKNQFDTFYGEHPRTYSARSFEYIARALDMGLLAVEFPSRYGGNIRVFMGSGELRGTTQIDDSVVREEAGFGRQFETMRTNMQRWRHTKGAEIRHLVDCHGPLCGKAFPARAAILVKLLGLDDASINAVFEKPGSMKIGHYLPGTRIPIKSDDELFGRPPTAGPLLNLAWHISSEIRSYLAQHGYTGPVIDIISESDFAPREGCCRPSQ